MSLSLTPSTLRRLTLAGLAVGWAWIAASCAPYFLAGPLHPFIIEKLPGSADAGWRAVLMVHVVSALFSLPACVLLTSETFRRRALWAHRVLGRVTAGVVLVALVPSGLLLARTATGGALTAAGFVLSGVITAGAVVRAVQAARAHRLAEHRRFMHHVLGQMGVAVISRALLVGAGLIDLDPGVAYLASLWIPVLGVAWGIERLHRPYHLTHGAVAMTSPVRALVALFVLTSLAPASSEAGTGAPQGVVEQLDRVLVQPLAAADAQQSRFSRAARPPRDRRARVTQATPSVDAAGGQFYAFSLDQRWSTDRSGAWEADAVVGCIYPATGRVYVQQSGEWLAASWLLGEPGEAPPATVCRAGGSS
jgi:uncharacterized membrane protein